MDDVSRTERPLPNAAPDGACGRARPWLVEQPENPEALRRSAQTAAQAGFPADAEFLLRKAIARAPGFPHAHADLAALLCRLNRAAEAIAMIDEAAASRPGTAWPLSIKSAVLTGERRDAEALEVHDQLVALAPEVPILWVNRGHTLKALGRVTEAGAAYRKALQLDPANGFAWSGLTDLGSVAAADIAALENALNLAGEDLQRVLLHFALGKVLSDQGRFERSFRHYEAANGLRATLVPYDGSAIRSWADRARELFSREFLAERAGQGCDARDPIFIVGLPRSGSTLVEQILASHPMIEGLGELFELPNIVADRLKGAAVPDLPQLIAGLDGSELRSIGETYLDAVRRYRKTDRPYFTDKLPANWQQVGLIRLILPEARIVDVRRHAVACCFSQFTTYFNRSTVVPTSLRDLGRLYRDYVGLTTHWEAVMPGRLHRVRYENLVEDLEREVRRLLAHLQLPFDPACLRFDRNPRPVHTASAQQVRRPLNRDGLDRWRNFEAWLGDLREELGLLGED